MNRLQQMEVREYDEWFDKAFQKMTKGREDHEFKHYNNALGCHVYGKEHYKKLMKQKRLIPYEQAEQLANDWDKEHPQKEYGDLSPKAIDIISSLKLTADGNGNIILGNRAIKALKEIGAMPASTEHAPKEYSGYGGFNNS